MRRVLANKRVLVAKTLNAAFAVCLVAGFSLWIEGRTAADAVAREQALSAARADAAGPYVADGVFSGTAQGYGGPVTVEVAVENGYIQSVDVVDAPGEDAPYLEQAETIIDDIVAGQTPNVDTVTGATFSSAAIVNGCVAALREGGN